MGKAFEYDIFEKRGVVIGFVASQKVAPTREDAFMLFQKKYAEMLKEEQEKHFSVYVPEHRVPTRDDVVEVYVKRNPKGVDHLYFDQIRGSIKSWFVKFNVQM